MQDDTRDLIKLWAIWGLNDAGDNLGYPKGDGRFSEIRGGGDNKITLPDDRIMEAVDRALSEMGAQHPISLQLLNLVYRKNRTYSQIAEIMRWPVGVVSPSVEMAIEQAEGPVAEHVERVTEEIMAKRRRLAEIRAWREESERKRRVRKRANI